MSFPPLYHDDQKILAGIKVILKNDVLLIAIFSTDPSVPSIIFLLQKHAPNPHILSDTALPIESILFLSDIHDTFCFLE